MMLLNPSMTYANKNDKKVETEEEEKGIGDKLFSWGSKAAGTISDVASDASDAASDFASDAGETAGKLAKGAKDVASNTAEKAGEAASFVGENLGAAASQLKDNVIAFASPKVETLSDAKDAVVTAGGQFVSFASDTAESALDAASGAYTFLSEKGKLLQEMIVETVDADKLITKEDWKEAQDVVVDTVETAFDDGVFGKVAQDLDHKDVKSATIIAFVNYKYVVLYERGDVTTAEAAIGISTKLINYGVPVGVGAVLEMTPFKGASDLGQVASQMILDNALGNSDEIEEAVTEVEEEMLSEATTE